MKLTLLILALLVSLSSSQENEPFDGLEIIDDLLDSAAQKKTHVSNSFDADTINVDVLTMRKVSDDLDPVYQCEVVEKLLEKFLEHEAKTATEQTEDKVLEDEMKQRGDTLRQDYDMRLKECVKKKMKENPKMAEAVATAKKDAEGAGVFRKSLKDVSSKEVLQQILIADGMPKEDTELLLSEEADSEQHEALVQRYTSAHAQAAASDVDAELFVQDASKLKWGGGRRRRHSHRTHHWRSGNQQRAAQASNLIYFDDNTVRRGMTHSLKGYSVQTLYHGGTGVDFGIFRNGNSVTLAYRGTSVDSVKDILTDLLAIKVTWPYGGSSGKVHGGFLAQFTDSRSRMYSHMSSLYHAGARNWVITGHSLGGALASLAAFYLKHHFKHASIDVVTFGGAMPADSTWTSNYASLIGHNTAAIVNKKDSVPCLGPMSAQPHIQHWAEEWPWSRASWHWNRVNSCWACYSVSDHTMARYCRISGINAHCPS
jgi:predicted lipase